MTAAAERARSERERGSTRPLRVAVTGITGTIGRGLVPLLESDERVGSVVGIARRDFDPRAEGWRKVDYRAIDVSDREAIAAAVAGADVVVHLAYNLHGVRQDEQRLYEVNVIGTRNVAEAALAGGAQRLVYTSSAAVYGFERGRGLLGEEAPVRTGQRHFYARHKAQAEQVLSRVLRGSSLEAYVFRPVAVVGPDAAGAAVHAWPEALRRAVPQALRALDRAGLARPVLAPPTHLQAVHQEDVGEALRLALLGHGPPGVYNLAGEGAVSGRELVRRLGFTPLPLPDAVARCALRGVAALPRVTPALGWSEPMIAPVLVDTTAARERLGWAPRHSSRDALDATRAALGVQPGGEAR